LVGSIFKEWGFKFAKIKGLDPIGRYEIFFSSTGIPNIPTFDIRHSWNMICKLCEKNKTKQKQICPKMAH